MSEEEKQAIEFLNNIEYMDTSQGDRAEQLYKSRDILFILIEKQQKELEELHKERNELVNPSNLRISYFDNKSQTQVVINGFVSKDKIREKIKELEKEKEENEEYGLDCTLIYEHEIDINAIIKVLQELLK